MTEYSLHSFIVLFHIGFVAECQTDSTSYLNQDLSKAKQMLHASATVAVASPAIFGRTGHCSSSLGALLS